MLLKILDECDEFLPGLFMHIFEIVFREKSVGTGGEKSESFVILNASGTEQCVP